MKKLFVIVMGMVMAMTIAGCGNASASVVEAKEPIVYENLGNADLAEHVCNFIMNHADLQSYDSVVTDCVYYGTDVDGYMYLGLINEYGLIVDHDVASREDCIALLREG